MKRGVFAIGVVGLFCLAVGLLAFGLPKWRKNKSMSPATQAAISYTSTGPANCVGTTCSGCGNVYAGPLTVISSTDNVQTDINSKTTTVITWVRASEVTAVVAKYVAVRIEFPKDLAKARYAGFTTSSMPIVIDTPQFMGEETWTTFRNSMPSSEFFRIGAIHVTFLKPGMSQVEWASSVSYPICSDGTLDGGAEDSRLYLKTVAEFATGAKNDRWSNAITSTAIAPNASTSNVGVYASSHTGMLALRAFAQYGLSGVSYFIGWENPIQDVYLTGELGRVIEDASTGTVSNEIDNYAYGNTPATLRAFAASDYDDSNIQLDAPFIRMGASLPKICNSSTTNAIGSACYQTDGTGGIFLGLGSAASVMSANLTQKTCQALCSPATCNSAFDKARDCPTWPSTMATPAQVNEWQRRAMMGATLDASGHLTPFNYFPNIATARPTDTLHAMLLFHQYDHKSGSPQKPKTQQAYRGLRSAGAWVRLNPERKYLEWAFSNHTDLELSGSYYFPDNIANTEPTSVGGWSSNDLTFSKTGWSIVVPTNAEYAAAGMSTSGDTYNRFKEYSKLAGLAEMMDRTRANNWNNDLPDVVYSGYSTRSYTGLAAP